MKKVHLLMIRVKFDKPCSGYSAATLAKQVLAGDYYPSDFRQEVEEMEVQHVREPRTP